jgi:hypothetical protein
MGFRYIGDSAKRLILTGTELDACNRHKQLYIVRFRSQTFLSMVDLRKQRVQMKEITLKIPII